MATMTRSNDLNKLVNSKLFGKKETPVPQRATPIAPVLKVVQAQPKQTIVPARTTPIASVIKVTQASQTQKITKTTGAPPTPPKQSVPNQAFDFVKDKVIQGVSNVLYRTPISGRSDQETGFTLADKQRALEFGAVGSVGYNTMLTNKDILNNPSNYADVLSSKFKSVVPTIKSVVSEIAQPHTSTGNQSDVIQGSVSKLISALKEAEPLQKEQAKIYSAERSKRLAKVLDVRGKTSGEAGLYAELGQLKGELPKVQFESLRNKVEQSDIDNLFNAVTQSNKLGEFEKINARQALAKVFGESGGAVPTAGELKLLKQVFPEEVVTTLLEKRPLLSRVGEGVVQAINLPRSLMSSFDLSAPLRQGLYMAGRPKQFFPAFASMFKQFGSEKAYKAVQESIEARPTYKLMRESKLALTDMNSILNTREEQFMSNWAEKIPLIGRGVRASGRAYTGFLNKLRADVFDSLVMKANDLGIEQTPKLTQDLAKFINVTTGRGNLGVIEPAATALNGIFFSPRLMASRIQMLNPRYYMNLDPFVRKEAMKTMLASGATVLTVLGLAKMGGAKVETDPRNADFAKIKFGNTRFDVMGGLQQYIRLASQLASGQIVSSTTGKTLSLGEGYKPLTRKDILYRFFENKENPVASFITGYLQGQNAVGEPFEVTDELVNRLVPMMTQSIREAMEEYGTAPGIAMSLPGVFGVGTQTYKQSEKQIENSKKEEAEAKVLPIYTRVQEFLKQGNTEAAQSLVEALTDEEYKTYTSIKASETRKENNEIKEKIKPVFDEVQELLKQGKDEEAQNIVNSMTDEEYKIYESLKTQS